jgi:hypothetical protein
MHRFRSLNMAVILLIVVVAIGGADAQTNVAHADPHYKVLHNFQGNPDANGNFDPLLVLGMTASRSRASVFFQYSSVQNSSWTPAISPCFPIINQRLLS